MKLNRPTAAFFTATYYLYGGNSDAIGVAYDLVLSTGFTGFGRERRKEAIKKIAPDLATALSEAGVDFLYIYAEDPHMVYKTVTREISRAEKWMAENSPVTTPYWPSGPSGWKYSVWELVWERQR